MEDALNKRRKPASEDDLRSGTAFGVLVLSRRRRRSPLSLRPPATVYQPFGLRTPPPASPERLSEFSYCLRTLRLKK
jgi:hypothetical protein